MGRRAWARRRAALIPRFYEANAGEILIGSVPIRSDDAALFAPDTSAWCSIGRLPLLHGGGQHPLQPTQRR
ncbi:MAG: hypothetical protein R2856_19550 [Caldilineaceae bacterium]